MAATPIYVVADAADARRLVAAKPAEGAVLAITPSARAIARATGLPEIAPQKNYGDCAQARTVVAVRRARERLVAAAQAMPGHRPTHREIALDCFHRAAYTSYRLWFTLGASGPWLVPQGEGWTRYESRREAHAALIAHMLTPVVTGQAAVARVRPIPMPSLYRALRRAVLRSACRGRVSVIAGARKGMLGLLNAVASHNPPPRLVVVQVEDGWRDYARLARGAWRVVRGEVFIDTALVARAQPSDLAAADSLIAFVRDDIIGVALVHYRELLAERLAQVEPALADAAQIVNAVRPRHYLAEDMSRLTDWAVAEQCGGEETTRCVLTRNSQVPPATPLAHDACDQYFRARMPEDLVDRSLFWSPHGMACARVVLAQPQSNRIEPVAALPVTAFDAARRSAETRRILVADTFSALWFTHSWIYQTSDEYLDGMIDLVRAVDALSGVSLTIRGKQRAELDLEAYRQLLPDAPNLTVKMRAGAIRDDLLSSDLLVASHSTTIEEALHVRRPVLLYGGTARYRFLPARTTPPKPNDRAAVYSAANATELRSMLSAILDCHAGAPLTDEELAPHVWPRGVPGVAEVARRMLA